MTSPETSPETNPGTSPEQDLHDLFDRTMRGVSPDVAGLHDHAVTAGRRLRRRRRIEAAVLAATTVAVVALPLAGSGDDTPSRGVPATSTDVSVSPSPDGNAEPTPDASATATPTPGGALVVPEPEATPFAARPGWWDMPVGPMLSRLRARLPEGVTIASYERRATDAAPGEPTRLQGTLSATLADADGVLGSIEVMLVQLPDDPDARAAQLAQDLGCDLSGWDFQELAGPPRCENDGPDTRSVSFTDRGVTYHEARRRVGDGQIYVAVANSTERKWGPPASAGPPALRPSQVAAIAADPAWTSWTPSRR
ncbi:hypothetical protein [Nocardioides pantholopis]|uniref:hypothetical protein n=1 Tax=Nocardioides pantholopis TaxID=2483798 RepID=UPI000F0852D8|nr:hypothetical protein [Nocardioides pantholopis]